MPSLIAGNRNLGIYTRTGGTANFTTAVYVGDTGAGEGIFNVSGGSFTTPVIYDGSSPGAVNQTGGTLTVGTGGVQMGGLGNHSSGVYTLTGGTLATPSVFGAVGSTFNFNGGTLQASADADGTLTP